MTHTSGPSLTPDEFGRLAAYGWLITGPRDGRYSAVPEVPLTEEERGWGLLTHTEHESLSELLVTVRSQSIVRDMIARTVATLAKNRRERESGELGELAADQS